MQAYSGDGCCRKAGAEAGAQLRKGSMQAARQLFEA